MQSRNRKSRNSICLVYVRIGRDLQTVWCEGEFWQNFLFEKQNLKSHQIQQKEAWKKPLFHVRLSEMHFLLSMLKPRTSLTILHGNANQTTEITGENIIVIIASNKTLGSWNITSTVPKIPTLKQSLPELDCHVALATRLWERNEGRAGAWRVI